MEKKNGFDDLLNLHNHLETQIGDSRVENGRWNAKPFGAFILFSDFTSTGTIIFQRRNRSNFGIWSQNNFLLCKSSKYGNTCLIHQSSTTILYPEWVSTFHGRSLERKEFGSDIHQIPVETKKKYFGAIGTQSKWHNDCKHYCQIQ